MKKQKQGKFVVIVGPSASGKTALVKGLLQKIPHSTRLITTTTRPRRPEENTDYIFITREEFEKGIAEDEYFEYANVYGNWYGSSRKNLETTRSAFNFVFAIIDVQGAQTLKSKVKDAIVIFIKPGSLEDIRRRLLSERGHTDKKELQKRMDTCAHEMALAKNFDHVVENHENKLEETVEAVWKIIK